MNRSSKIVPEQEKPMNPPGSIASWSSLVTCLLLLTSMVVPTMTVIAQQGVEICDNCIDDDGDQLIDGLDPDCTAEITFTDSGQALGNASSVDVGLGDLDGDGDLDAWIANCCSQPNRVWLNDGLGNFSDSGQALGNDYSTGVDLGDLDGDGDLDAWVANSDDPNRVWFNDGLGNFTDSGQALGGDAFSRDVELGDLDGDGDLDALVVNTFLFLSPNRVWINDGLGNFTDSGQELGNGGADVELGDLDDDGDLDAWFAYFPGSEPDQIWFNDGLGNFSDSGQALGNYGSFHVDLGDLDGDGDLDAWVAIRDNQTNRVWINDGIGNFTDSGQALGNSDGFSVDLGDFDCDGDLDAWVANYGGQPNRIWVNDGVGNFTDSGQALGNSDSLDIALADLDADGDLDAWVANLDSQPNHVWKNDTPCSETLDCNANEIPDDCEVDCNFNGIPDDCDIASGFSLDIDGNLIPDECDNQGPDPCLQIEVASMECDPDGTGHLLSIAFTNLSGLTVHKVVIPGEISTTSGTATVTDNVIVFTPGIADGAIGTVVVPISGAVDGDLLTVPFALMHKNDDGSVVECCSDEVIIEAPPCLQEFIRCDTNRDGGCDIGDAIFILTLLFNNGTPCSCLDSCDCNDDGSIDIGDAIYKLAFLFNGGPAPPSPHPECGPDPTPDNLDCASFPPCP